MSTKKKLLEDTEEVTTLLEDNGLSVMTINGLHIYEKDGCKYSFISFSVENKWHQEDQGA